MKKILKQLHFLLLIMAIVLMPVSCKKFLDERPDKNLIIPQKWEDLQALLDNSTTMNGYITGIGEASADNYYLTDADWASFIMESDKNMYIWADEIFFNNYPNVWSETFKSLNVANYVLEHADLLNYPAQAIDDVNNLKGSALFFRARVFHMVAIGWSKQYDSITASADLGVPLRLSSDFTKPSERVSVKTSYDHIIADLQTAIPLLPINPKHVMRPSRPAAYGLLSRVYLSMRNYSAASRYADSCLALYNTLLDYNHINQTPTYPIANFNPEVIFHAQGIVNILINSRAKVDSALYNMYSTNDLRKNIFFRNNNNGTYGFRGNYSGGGNLFVGIATDEIYLTKAECLARFGDYKEAMNLLNQLLIKRWKDGTFVPLTAADAGEALQIILTERRKQLLMRDLRWMDIKRLNKEEVNIRPKRLLNGQVYELLPNENRYALPLPAYILSLSGMPQNPR